MWFWLDFCPFDPPAFASKFHFSAKRPSALFPGTP
jgi:hypothetical protein